jgi:hypothetical protein
VSEHIKISKIFILMKEKSWEWWCTPLIPALGGRGRWISEFKASLVYKVSSRTARATEKPRLEKPKKKKKKKKEKEGDSWVLQGFSDAKYLGNWEFRSHTKQ